MVDQFLVKKAEGIYSTYVSGIKISQYQKRHDEERDWMRGIDLKGSSEGRNRKTAASKPCQ